MVNVKKKARERNAASVFAVRTKLIAIDHKFLAHEGTPDNVYLQESAIISRINFLDRLKIDFGQKEGDQFFLGC